MSEPSADTEANLYVLIVLVSHVIFYAAVISVVWSIMGMSSPMDLIFDMAIIIPALF